MFQQVMVSCLALWLSAAAVPAGAQTRPAASREAELGRGWQALSDGRPAIAGEIAGRLQLAHPGDHDVASLSIAAALAGAGPVRALDTYEAWLEASTREDPFLLDDIGMGHLAPLSKHENAGIRFAALAAMARNGDTAAGKAIAAADAASLTVEADAALARAGHAAAVSRLAARITAGGPQDKSAAIEALRDTGQPGVVDAIATALTDPAPPSRITAALALAELGAREALPRLRAAAADPEPAVRGIVAVALGLLGDPEHRDDVAALATSPLGDYRLLHLRGEARNEASGLGWVGPAEALLKHDDPAVRIGAAELLMTQGRFTTAAPVLMAALDDPSAPTRLIAARILPRLAVSERALPLLRKALRDRLPEVQVEAARALLIRR